MDTPHGVGARIGAIRRRRGLTQKELAGRIGRSVNTLSALERGLAKPGFDTLLSLASALGVPAGDFFAPAAGDGADRAPHAALYGELLNAARSLPLAELELTVRIAAAVAGWFSEVGGQKSEVRGTGTLNSEL
jgi:transcriptional regulator with XRE-family HTH domain